MVKKGWKVFTKGDDGELLSAVMPDVENSNNLTDDEWKTYTDTEGLHKRGFSLFGIDKNEVHRPFYFFSEGIAENNYEKYMNLLNYIKRYSSSDLGNKIVYEVEVDDVIPNEDIPEDYDHLRDFPEEYQAKKIRRGRSLEPTEEQIEALKNGEGSALARWKAKQLPEDLHSDIKEKLLKDILREENIRQSIDRMFPQDTTISDHILKAIKRRF